MLKILGTAGTAVLLLAVARAQSPASRGDTLDAIAESYVKLALRVGLYDPDYIDAYYGPAAWKPAPLSNVEKRRSPSAELKRKTQALLGRLEAIQAQRLSALEQRRLGFLRAQLASVEGRIDLLAGKKMSFDAESKALYDAVAPRRDAAEFEAALKELDKLLPGAGDVSERFRAYRMAFVVPEEKVKAVLEATMAEARERTLRHLTLPSNEGVDIELVRGQSWAGYNWYKGHNRSLIQVSSDRPFYIDRAIFLACHEGYPGHHVQNVLRDDRLYVGRRWVEFSVVPLLSPMNLIAEGAANYVIDLAFPDSERLAFERDVLFPLAGLDPSKAEQYRRVSTEVRWLPDRASAEAARRYLDGQMSREDTIAWLRKYALKTDQEAELSMQFIEKYRSYTITYTQGEDMLRTFIEEGDVGQTNAGQRWERLYGLMAEPATPASLR
jgi:hypothetical protein